MKIQHKNIKQSGFAVVEAIFTIVIVGLIVGGGIYLFQRKSDTPSSQSTFQY